MAADIFVRAEKRTGDRWQQVAMGQRVFVPRHYGLFGFLTDERNYSAVPPLSQPRGLPEGAVAPAADPNGVDDADDGFIGERSFSWLAVSELTGFDYEQTFEDRRDNGTTLPPGAGTRVSYREFLGEHFFQDLERLKAAGAERIVFGFTD
jgi:hypothetical protein